LTGQRIGHVLQATRETKGMTQQALAKRAKVARSYLAKLEAGHSKNPSLAVLQRLAKALGVPVTDLLP
jgi:transcriptional regulator with XRE-family HTH domain